MQLFLEDFFFIWTIWPNRMLRLTPPPGNPGSAPASSFVQIYISKQTANKTVNVNILTVFIFSELVARLMIKEASMCENQF